jgi:LPXTG-site transpeptidase (sortase) family protein
LKAYAKSPLLFITIAVLFILLLFLLIHVSDQKPVSRFPVPHQTTNHTTPGIPVLLTIPVINVLAAAQQVGVTQLGTMDIPGNTVDVAWFKLGPRPGEKGSAVIAGHLDGTNGEAGVFIDLYKLKKGDMVYVKDDTGTTITFVVRESRIYNPGYAEEVFSSNDGVHLNLITCDGAWNGSAKSYSKRLVVFADKAD